MGHGLEAYGHGAEVKVHIGHDLAGLHGNGVQSEAVVVAGQQIGGQHLIVCHVVGLIQNPVSQAGAVSSGGQHRGIGDIGGDAVVPVEGLQRHIAGVRHRNVITHLAADHDLGIAPLGDGHAQRRGLVVGGELDDLACIFQRHIMDGGIQLPVRRSLDFTNLVAGQRKCLTGCDTPGIGGDVIHDLAAAGIDDLKDRTCQRRAGCSARDLVILGSILVNLDLAGDGFVLPFDFDSLASSDIDRLHLGVHIVALILQFTNIVAAGLGQASDIHPAVLVRFILADGVLITVVEQEGHAIDALARGAVDLMDQNAGQGLILNGERGGLAILHLEIMRRVVQFKSIRIFDFNGIIAAIFQREEGTAILIGGHGIHKTVICTADLELHIGDALGLFVGIDFDDLNAADGIVIEIQALRVVGVHNHSLGAGLGVDAVIRQRILFRHDQCADYIGEDDLPVGIGHIGALSGELAALGIHIGAIGIGDFELNALQGLAGDGIQFVDDQVALGLVSELQCDGLACSDACGLRCIVQNVAAILGARLFYDQRGAGIDTFNQEGTCAVGGELAIGIAHHSAVRSGDEEFHIRQRLAAHTVDLFDQQSALGRVAEVQLYHILILAADIGGLGRSVNDVAAVAGQFFHDIGAFVETSNGETAVGRSLISADDRTACAGGASQILHLEDGVLHGLSGDGIKLKDHQGAQRGVLEGYGLALAGLDEHFLRGGIFDPVAGHRFQFGDFVPAILQIGDLELAVLVGIEIAKIIDLTALGFVAGVNHLELCALQRLARHAADFIDGQAGLLMVFEIYRMITVGIEGHQLTGSVQQIRRRNGLFRNFIDSGKHVLQLGPTVLRRIQEIHQCCYRIRL